MNDFNYELKQGIFRPFVKITDNLTGHTFSLVKPGIELAILNTKAGKGGHVTREAYDRTLKMYEDALRVFGNE